MEIVAFNVSFQAVEFLVFATLMFIDMFLLALVARKYQYVDYTDGSIDRNSQQVERAENDEAENYQDLH